MIKNRRAHHPAARLKQNKGFTLAEAMFAGAIACGIIVAMGYMASNAYRFLSSNSSRQLANSEARTCLETIERALSRGRFNTLTISTPDLGITETEYTLAAIPNSKVDFLAVDGSSYTITMSTSPSNSIHLLKTPPNGGVSNDTVLTTHAKVMMFTFQSTEQRLINVALQMSVAVPGKDAYTVSLPARTIRMAQD